MASADLGDSVKPVRLAVTEPGPDGFHDGRRVVGRTEGGVVLADRGDQQAAASRS
jgi:hypothetical protein